MPDEKFFKDVNTQKDQVMGSALNAALNRLAKWRAVFAGWQLGTRPKGDPESDAVREHREATILLRAEVSALEQVMHSYFPDFSHKFARALLEESEHLQRAYEGKFPGAKATDEGMSFGPEATEWMSKFRP